VHICADHPDFFNEVVQGKRKAKLAKKAAALV
jgi:hypothetical protein